MVVVADSDQAVTRAQATLALPAEAPSSTQREASTTLTAQVSYIAPYTLYLMHSCLQTSLELEAFPALVTQLAATPTSRSVLLIRRPPVVTRSLDLRATPQAALSLTKLRTMARSRTLLPASLLSTWREGRTDICVDEFGGDNAGDSFSGEAIGGSGRDRGPGGNAASGNAGASNGGRIVSSGGTVTNTDASEFSVAIGVLYPLITV